MTEEEIVKYKEKMDKYQEDYNEAQEKVDEFICYIFAIVKRVIKNIVLTPLYLIVLIIAMPVILTVSLYEFMIQLVMLRKK